MSSEMDNTFELENTIQNTCFSKKYQRKDTIVMNNISESINNTFQNDEENISDSKNNVFHENKWKKSNIINDSDSEEHNLVSRNDENDHESLIVFNEKKHKRLAIVDSDSEEEVNNSEQLVFITNSDGPSLPENANVNINENNNEPLMVPSEKKRKGFPIVDSDSEQEIDQVTPHNKSFSDEAINSSEQPVFVTNSDGKLVPENVNVNNDISQAILSTLCDPESSEDEIDLERKYEERDSVKEIDLIPNKKKKKPKENNIIKPKKMTGKQAAELRKEIKSESQRMLREKNISLPYHKPKSYTIKEFLSKRPKFSSAVPTNVKVPPSVAIKMSTEQLALVTEKLKEREKEVEQFYKSESESEDDHEDKDYVPPFEESESNKEPNAVTASDDVRTEENHPELTLPENSSIISEAVVDEFPEEGKSGSINIISDIVVRESDPVECMEISGNTTVEQESNQPEDQVNVNPMDIDTSNKELELKEESNQKDFDSQDTSKDLEENNANSKKDNKAAQSSMDYEFSLEGLEDNSENVLENENPQEKTCRFEYTDLDREIENFGSEKDQVTAAPTEHSRNLSKLELLTESIANVTPRLTGGPDDVIDLETGVAKPNEVTKLMKRFVEHNFKKPVHKDKVELSIISFESGEIHKETLAMKLDDENETMTVEEKPGAKLQKLRGELQSQMAQKRSELWQKRSSKQSGNEEANIYEGEKEDCGLENDILDNEEEELEMTESSEDEEDEEEQENFAKEKEKKKSQFIDEEAEESDEEEDVIEATSEDEVANEADDENEIDDLSDCDEKEDGDNEETDVINESEIRPEKKTFKKILKGFTEDSDEEELTPNSEVIEKNENRDTLSQDDEDIFPPHQPQNSQTPIRQPKTPKKSQFDFLTPISYISGLQNFNSDSKSLKDSPVTSAHKDTDVPSPLKEENWQHNLQKKLFMDTEITDSQAEKFYSEQFPETQESKDSADLEQTSAPHVDEFPCTSNTVNEENLVDLCSGKFPSTVELPGMRLNEQTPTTQDLLDICSGGFTGITQAKSLEKPETITETPVDTYLLNTNKEIKSLDEDQDLVISQLIDEEEMEKFKKRFESPLISNTQRRIIEEFEEDIAGGGVIDSDDDTDTVGVKRRNQKRIMFSDDESSEDENNAEEVIDLHDNVEDDEDSNMPADNIAYDSEENEIEFEGNGGGRNTKPSDFFENEAELSESEWGSADEDEKDLDTMEFEQGDTEKYDEKQMKSDLEKIHMRRLLEDDTREVKLLQEMLLEDGELHGTGRERQFKWKNIDSVAETDETRKEEDDVYLDEEESEEQWRKKRHEREMFLKEKSKNSQEVDDDSLLSESQLLKIGQRVLQRSQSNSQNGTPADKNNVEKGSPILKHSFTLLNKRGSFLSRSDQVLQRLAEYNKVTSVTLGTATAKNSRNFVFQTVTVEKTSVTSIKDKKRKAADGTSHAIKKLRLSNNLSPAGKQKPTAKAKLFGNW